MRYLLLQSLTDFLVLALCNVHISSHPLNKQEQVTLPEGEKLWFYLLNGESLEPIVLPWKCLVIVPLFVLFRNNDNHLFFCCFNEMITTEYIQRQWNFIWLREKSYVVTNLAQVNPLSISSEWLFMQFRFANSLSAYFRINTRDLLKFCTLS